MKRKLSKILASLLCVVMIITAAPLSGFVGIEIPWLSDLFKIEASAASYSGTCGDNLTWTLDTETGVLDITGTGDMTNWQYSSSAPWYSYRSYIKFVNIGNSVTSIGNYAFDWCDSLISATIGNSVTSIGAKAFYNCDSLTSITIPDSVTSIGNYAFEDCDRLASVTIPDSVTSIGEWAFIFCDSLTSVTIGNSVTSIGDYAFYHCDSLEKITVDTNNKYYSNDEYGVLFNKDKTTLIQYPMGNTRTTYTIPDSVTSIGTHAFYECDRLTSVTIPDSVTSIGDSAFCFCRSLTSVTIGNSVTSIGELAFSDCESLTSVTIGNSVIIIGVYAFSNCDSLTDVYYFGTEDQWNKIRIGYSNELLTNATIHFNSPGKDFHPHSYTSTITKEATCSATGVKTYVCSCGDTYSKEIPVADHSLTHETVAPTCKAQGCEYDYCSSCKGSFNKVYLPTVEHSWGEWKVTEEDKDIETRECSVCHDIETVTIPGLKKVSKVTIDDFVVKYKDPYKLTPKIEADEGVEYEITYKSSNPDVVSIDKNGNITTNDKGSATITVTVTDEFGNEVTDTCNVEVKLKWWQWIIWIFLWGWAWY